MKVENSLTPESIGRWRILSQVGQGSFGCIYKAECNNQAQTQQPSFDKVVAIKSQLITNVKQMLLLEYQIYKQFEGQFGFPKVFQYGEEDRFSYMAFELLETSLDKFAVSRFPKQFAPVNVVLQIMMQTLAIVQKIHARGYLYRDMKPSNLMVKQPYQQVYIIDFGLCKKYIVNGRHIALKQNKKMVGTPLFCSLNTHAGLEQSRRDDLESWVWTNLFFAVELPWQSVIKKEQNKQSQYSQIFKLKKETKWDEYIKSTGSPRCISKIIQYIRGLQFEQQPDYTYLSNLIKNEYLNICETELLSFRIDWETKIPLSSIALNYSTKDGKQEEVEAPKSESPRKVRKINFKLPPKLKASESEPLKQSSQ